MASARVLIFLAANGCAHTLAASHPTTPTVTTAAALLDREGEEVTVEGTLGHGEQHLVTNIPEKLPRFLDLTDGEIVVYVRDAWVGAVPRHREELRCAGKLRMTGRVILARGASKRPGASEELVRTEPQIDVSHWECVP